MNDPAILPQSPVVEVFVAARAGVIQRVEPRVIGKAVVRMGGGRQKVDDVVDPTVGMVISARPGAAVDKGEPLASIYARDDAGVEIARKALQQSIEIGDEDPEVPPLIAARVSAKGFEQL